MMDFTPLSPEGDVQKVPYLYTHGHFRVANLTQLSTEVLQLPFEVFILLFQITAVNRLELELISLLMKTVENSG